MKKIAVDSAQFSKIIAHNKIYVDKTRFLYTIATENTYYFLSRPRRFGKTLFIDTLENFFKGNRDLFEGLYVYEQIWSWDEYPLIRLDFNSIPHENRSILEESLKIRFSEIAEYYNLQIKSDKAYYQLTELVKVLSNKFNKGVVVLIDEYDKPIISYLGHAITSREEQKKLQIAKENQEFLKILYDNLKSLEPYLKTVFITGVTKFSKLSIFSTLNNLIEIDQDPFFAEIMGYTEDELLYYFMPYLKKLGDYYEVSLEEAIRKFRRTYNGFRFTEKNVQVYNPYSSGRALYFSRLDNYWFESGTPTFLIMLIKERGFDVTNLHHIEIGRDEIMAYDIEKLQLIPLLFQTGYLTIKDVEDEIIYVLGYPNIEVERGFNQNLINSFSEDRIGTPVII